MFALIKSLDNVQIEIVYIVRVVHALVTCEGKRLFHHVSTVFALFKHGTFAMLLMLLCISRGESVLSAIKQRSR